MTPEASAHVPVERAVVLGAGTMGAQIAAHLASAGVRVLLLDMASADGPRSAVAQKGLDLARKADPAAFMTPEAAELVTVGNFDDDLPRVKDADWVIEAIVERLDVKAGLFARLEPHLGPRTVVSSNTSGISIAALGQGRSEGFRQRFLGTHFFNPPRYLHLLETIAGPDTRPDVLARIEAFGDVALGKGVVRAKDTPNFIANRIGIFGAMRALQAFSEEGLSFAEVDRITGSLVGRPKSATFRTFDLVGLDVVMHVARNVYDNAPDDERRGAFVAPDFVQRMVAEGRLGDKTGQGFYRKVKAADGSSQILALHPESFEYREQGKVKLPSLEMVSQMEGLGDRLRALVFARDRVGSFLQKTLLETLAYAAARIPEIADDVADVDRAMEWGFGWAVGPFETWDLLGVERTLPLLEARGVAVPPLVKGLLASGRKAFYETDGGTRRHVDLGGALRAEMPRPGVISIPALKEQGRVLKKNGGASLVDLGDGVLCVEFHSKMNAIGGDTLGMLQAGLAEVRERYAALVVANEGDSFCVGANLMLLMLEAQEGNFDEIDLMVRQLQKINMAFKTSPKPVVMAPFGMTLGGGLEVTLHGTHVQAAAESYMGLVELGVGLIPAGGGTKELYLRHLERIPPGGDPFPAVRAAFEAIGMAKVCKSAHEGRAMGFLRSGDGISMNRDRLTKDAKELALSMVRRGYRPRTAATRIPALGASALATLKTALHQMRRGGYVSDYDVHVGQKLARILAGGDLSHATEVTEERLLDLEREAFLSLCGERRTLERIQHMLKTGKPLRN